MFNTADDSILLEVAPVGSFEMKLTSSPNGLSILKEKVLPGTASLLSMWELVIPTALYLSETCNVLVFPNSTHTS